MRKTLLVGLGLIVAAVVVAFMSSWFDLELESVSLLGAALGAVIALVPDRSPLVRLAGFLGGFVAAWVGYLMRAAVLPDSSGGRAVAVGLVVAIALGIALASMGRIPLWSTLLGAGAFAGAMEHPYAAAPPEVATTSVSTATALLLTVSVGFLAVALISPFGEPQVEPRRRGPRVKDDSDRLDDLMMEKTK